MVVMCCGVFFQRFVLCLWMRVIISLVIQGLCFGEWAGLEGIFFSICNLSTFSKSSHCSCKLPGATSYVLRSDLMDSQLALLNPYRLVLVCFEMFALVFRSTNTMSWSAVAVSGAVVATQLTRKGFDVKNRSSIFDF